MENDSPLFESTPVDDDRVERLLRGAYDAPAMPASLLRRLDRQIAQEWGHSPGLVVTRPSILQRSRAFRQRWLRAVPMAACSVVIVMAFLLLGRGSTAYAWASMVEALERQGVVQLDGPDGSRWLSLTEGVLCERSASLHVLIDVRQQVILERDANEPRLRRRSLAGRDAVPDHDHLVLAFLMGNATSKANASRLEGARLIQQKWDYGQQDGHKNVSLFVRWKTSNAEQLDFRLTLDPVTQLPLKSESNVTGLAAAPSVRWSYPAARAAELRTVDFPANYEVIDVDDQGMPISMAAAEAGADSDGSGTQGRKRTVSTGDLEGTPAVRLADASATAGAASQWKPVAVTARTRSEVVQQIDSLLENLWRANGVDPAPLADDEELLRRVYLDLCGRTPSIHEIRTYLADHSPNRYEVLVERLLRNRDHSSHLATIWRSFLIPEGVDLTAFGGVDGFDRWLADRFGNNDAYDAVVRGLLLAEGRLSRSGPLLFYSAVKLDPDLLAARSARVFLGMRLECAQCHDHPFEPWTQEDFWGFAAFFAQISRPRGELQAASTVMQVRDVDHGEVKMPKGDSAIPPRFLNQMNQTERSNGKPEAQTESRRQQLAKWLTDAENPYFTRATANRVWSILFAKGIVDPVDDFGVRHQPRSPELLELLAGHFASTHFDLRDLIRTIALSRAYRLSSGAATADPKRAEWFAQMNVKTLSAEQVFDCLTVATLLDSVPTADPNLFNIARDNNSERDQFLQQFRTPTGRPTEYLGGIPQALTLMNGSLIANATGISNSGLLKSLEAPFFTNQQRIEVLYLATLSRHPRPAEWDLLKTYINDQTSTAQLRENLSDILWALLNSAEFTMNH